MKKDLYYMEIVHKVAERSDCFHRKVGCVIVKNDKIISTGFNGNIKGHMHCRERGICIKDKLAELSCKFPSRDFCRAIHAEQNALLFSNYQDLEGADVYASYDPCETCLKLFANAGVKRIIYGELYIQINTEYDENLQKLREEYIKSFEVFKQIAE